MMHKRNPATGRLAVLAVLSQLLLFVPAGSGDTHLTNFSSGAREGDAVFGPEAGNSTPLEMVLPREAYVLNASLSLEGLPSVMSGGAEATTDEDFNSTAGKRNITISGGSVGLSRASGGWAQSADADFLAGRLENVAVSGGVKLSRGASYSTVVENLTVSPFRASQLDAASVVTSTGNLVLAWADLRSGTGLDIYARIIDPAGTPVTPDIVVCGASGHQRGPAVALDGSDNFFVVWHDERAGDSDIYGRKFGPAGAPAGDEFSVCNAASDQGHPSICAGPSGKMLAAWDDFRDGKHYAVRCLMMNPDGTPYGMENRVTSYPTDQLAPSVCPIGGGFAIVYQNTSNLTGADVECALLDGNGSLSTRFVVSNAQNNQSSPRIAPGPSGKFCAVWEDRRGGNDFDITGRWYDPDGRPSGSESAVCFAVGDQRRPSLSVRAAGDVLVAWEDGRSGDADVHFKRYDSGWNPVGTDVAAVTGVRDQDGPAAAFDEGGAFFIAWSDWRDGLPNVRMQKYGNPKFVYSAGMLVSPPVPCFAATYGSVGLCITLPRVARLAADTTGFRLDILDGTGDYILQAGLLPGDHVLVEPRLHGAIRLAISLWTRDGNITPVMTRWSVGTAIEEDFDAVAGGARASTRITSGEVTLEKAGSPGPLGGEFALKNDSAGHSQVALASFQDGSGDFVAAWRDGAGSFADITARRFTRNGVPVTAEAGVCGAPGQQDSPDIAVDLNGVVTVVWVDNRSGSGFDIYLRRFGPDLAPSGPELAVCASAPDQRYPQISADPGNNIVLVWVDYTLVYMTLMLQKFRPDLTAVCDPVRVSYSDLSLLQPAAATDSSGRIVITWVDYRNANPDIYASIFRPDCTPVHTGEELPVAAKPGDQWAPAVSVDQNGSLVIAWEDRAPLSDPHIHARKIDLNGTNLTGELVISDKPGGQMRPAVAFDSTGGFMAVWQSYDKAFNLAGNYFDPSGAPSGPEFVICKAINTEGNPADSVYAALAWGPDDDFVTAWEDNRALDDTDLWARAIGFPSVAPSGTFTTRAYDLVHAPLSLDMTGWNASVPAGTSVGASLRSGPDGQRWSDWEPAAARQSSLATPPARFVQWRFSLSTSVFGVTPALQGVFLRYTTYATNGTLVSPALEVPFGVSEIAARWNATLNGEIIVVELSRDNGTGWTGCRSGAPVAGDPAARSSALRYRVFLHSNGSASPVLEDISIHYSATSYPTDARLDLGGDGAIEWSSNGTFNTTVRVSGLEDSLNGILSAQTGGGPQVQIPLILESATAGIIRVTNLSVLYNTPPVISSAEPSGNEPVILEGGQVDFSVAAVDSDGDGLSMVWTVNGRAVQNSLPDYRFAADYASSGAYDIAVVVSDRYFSVNRTWHLTVLEVNRPPSIQWSPDGNVTSNETEKTSFWAVVYDPDADAVNIAWALDGVPVSDQPAWEYISGYNSSGTHAVSVRVFDGTDAVFHNWTVTVLNRNRPPVIINATPAPGGTIRAYVGRPVMFSVAASDPDGEPLSYAWKVNGRAVAGESGASFTSRKGVAIGPNTIEVEVSDGNSTARQQWELAVSLARQDEVESAPFPWAVVAGVIVLLAAIAMAFIYRRMSRRDDA